MSEQGQVRVELSIKNTWKDLSKLLNEHNLNALGLQEEQRGLTEIFKTINSAYEDIKRNITWPTPQDLPLATNYGGGKFEFFNESFSSPEEYVRQAGMHLLHPERRKEQTRLTEIFEQNSYEYLEEEYQAAEKNFMVLAIKNNIKVNRLSLAEIETLDRGRIIGLLKKVTAALQENIQLLSRSDISFYKTDKGIFVARIVLPAKEMSSFQKFGNKILSIPILQERQEINFYM